MTLSFRGNFRTWLLAGGYTGLVLAVFVGRYVTIRSEEHSELSDFSSAVIWVGLVAFVFTLAIGNPWSMLLPLLTFPLALLMYATAALDPSLPAEVIWFSLAGTIAIIGFPAALAGYGVRKAFRLRPGRRPPSKGRAPKPT